MIRRKENGGTRNTVLARYCIHRLVCWDVNGAARTHLGSPGY